MSDAGDKVSAEVKKDIQDKIEELKKIKDGSDTETVKKTTEELSKKLQAIGEAMYKNTPAGAGQLNSLKTRAEGRQNERRRF